jgi:hypothetical protein
LRKSALDFLRSVLFQDSVNFKLPVSGYQCMRPVDSWLKNREAPRPRSRRIRGGRSNLEFVS